jgi:GNAT superfamily N-acetyltransferase
MNARQLLDPPTARDAKSESSHRAPGFAIRDATPADNEQLIALSAACAMAGDISLRIDRGPDFFALNRLEGVRWQVGVAEANGHVVGCIAISERRAFVNGVAARTAYVGDFKVHPDYRDTRIADALSHYAERVCADLPPAAPVMIAVLAGNRAMERRLSGPRGVAAFRRLGTIRTHSIPLLWHRRSPKNPSVLGVETARWSDLDEMVKVWNKVAPHRQLAPAWSAESLAEWIRAAPGLDISSYRLARSLNGEIVGFFAIWDQRTFKQLTVVGYSRRMRLARAAFNALTVVVGGERLPAAGSPLSCVSIVNVCVPRSGADVLRALVLDAYAELRGKRCSFMNIGLDMSDPLAAALTGLLAQPTDVNAYVMTTRAGVLPEFLEPRALHYEIALV